MTGLLLYYIALALVIVLYGMLFPVSVVIDFHGTNERLRKSAVVIDVLGNILFAPVWNVLLITEKATCRFGNLWQTISAVLGYAQQERELTKVGTLLVYLLHRIDPYHCELAIGLNPTIPIRKWWQKTIAIIEVLAILILTLGCPFLILFIIAKLIMASNFF